MSASQVETIKFKCQACHGDLEVTKKNAGMRVICNRCFEAVIVPGPAGGTLTGELNIDLGKIISSSASIQFRLIVKSNGVGHIQVFAHDKGKSVLLQLGQDEADALRTIVQRMDATVAQLMESGQLEKQLSVQNVLY